MTENLPNEKKLALSTDKKIPRKKVFYWALYDWGNQPWATVITTFVFAV